MTPDGNTLLVGSGSASLVAFDLTKNPPQVIAALSTGASPDFDGPVGVAPCIATWNGGAGSDPTCADDRADEMAYGTVGGHDIVAVANGDQGFRSLPSGRHGHCESHVCSPFTTPGQGHCLPVTILPSPPLAQPQTLHSGNESGCVHYGPDLLRCDRPSGRNRAGGFSWRSMPGSFHSGALWCFWRAFPLAETGNAYYSVPSRSSS